LAGDSSQGGKTHGNAGTAFSIQYPISFAHGEPLVLANPLTTVDASVSLDATYRSDYFNCLINKPGYTNDTYVGWAAIGY